MNSRLRWVNDWIERAQECHWRVAQLARNCGISVNQLEMFFLARFRCRPHELLRRTRLKIALRLLSCGKLVKEAASEAGYKQSSHFSRDFKRVYGVPPACMRPPRTTKH